MTRSIKPASVSIPQSLKDEAAEHARRFEIEFVREKDTKNCVRFAEKTEPGKPPRIGSLYVQKWAVGDAPALKVTVAITAIE